MPWLSEKPASQGGPWRIGCDVCAWYSRQRVSEEHKGRWGCNVRPCASARHAFYYSGNAGVISKRLKAHECEDGHREAALAAKRAAHAPACVE